MVAGGELHHPETTYLPARLSPLRTTPVRAITHFSVSGAGIRIGTARGCHTFLRKRFVDASGPEDLAHAIGEAMARSEGRGAAFEHMRELDLLAQRERTPVSHGVAILCVVVFALQWVFQPELLYAGEFSASFVRAGELYRLVTANFLHGSLVHLALNVLGLRFLGAFVERPLGSHATFFVLALSGIGAMVGSYFADYASAVGASGMVFGLAGALVWLELGRARDLPVSFRLPRRLLLTLVAAETVVLSLVPIVAGAAHVGGLVAGYLAARVAGSTTLPASAAWLPRANAPIAALAMLAVVTAGVFHFARGDEYALRQAERLLQAEGVHPMFLNNAAWKLVTESEPEEETLDLALRLATRAVALTERREPTILDTLAEIHFVGGRNAEALRTIDEAISLKPEESYYLEQKRRFLGERDADDRPAAPDS